MKNDKRYSLLNSKVFSVEYKKKVSVLRTVFIVSLLFVSIKSVNGQYYENIFNSIEGQIVYKPISKKLSRSEQKYLTKKQIIAHHVKSVTDSTFELIEKFGEIQKGKVLSSNNYKYDTHGNTIERTYYGKPVIKSIFNYDTKGQLVGSYEYEFSHWRPQKRTIYKYNINGKVIEHKILVLIDSAIVNKDISTISKDIYNSSVANVYDEKGNHIESNYYNDNGSLSSKQKYKYDKQNNNIEWAEYYSDGSLKRKEKYSYDGNGNLISYLNYRFDGSLLIGYTFNYDERGNIIHDSSLIAVLGDQHNYIYDDSNRLIEESSFNSRTTYSFDGNGNVVEESQYIGTLLRLDDKYEYDSHGNITGYTRYAANGDIVKEKSVTWKYEYDKNGNWIKLIPEGGKKRTIERKIIYY